MGVGCRPRGHVIAERSSTRRTRRTGVRRSVLVGTVSLGSLMTGGSAAEAASNFGGLYAGPTPTNYGGRSNITVPPNSTTETVASNEILLHRVVTQGNGPSGVGLVQAGLYRSGTNTHLDLCNSSVGQYQLYVETLPQGSGNYKCNLYGTATFGHDITFKVTGDGSGSWQAGGADEQTGASSSWGYGALGFNSGFTAISTEMNNPSPTQVADGSTSNAVFGGGAGSDPSWLVYAQPSYGGQFRPSSSQTAQLPHTNPGTTGSPGTWSVPNVPTPVRFKHAP